MSGFGISKNQHLEKSHYETKHWISDIQFWSDELNFFLRILTDKINSNSEGKTIVKLNNLNDQVSYYQNTLIKHFQKVLKEHENKLAHMISGQYTYYDSYESEHANISGHINSFRQEFRMFKKEFYISLIETTNRS
ncbi:MAG: hypothetical protein AAGF85_09715 [Bacteroidota bacterium]